MYVLYDDVLGGISSSILSVFFTDKFALSQSDARISVAYKICQWKTLTKRLMKCPPDVFNEQPEIQKIWNWCNHYQDIYDWISPFDKLSGIMVYSNTAVYTYILGKISIIMVNPVIFTSLKH